MSKILISVKINNETNSFEIDNANLSEKIENYYQPENDLERVKALEAIMKNELTRSFYRGQTYEGTDIITGEKIVGSFFFMTMKGYAHGNIVKQIQGKIKSYKGKTWRVIDNPKQK